MYQPFSNQLSSKRTFSHRISVTSFWTYDLLVDLFNIHPTCTDDETMACEWSFTQRALLVDAFRRFCIARTLNKYFEIGRQDLFRHPNRIELINELGIKASSWHHWVCKITEFKFVRVFESLGLSLLESKISAEQMIVKLDRRLLSMNSTRILNVFWSSPKITFVPQADFERFDELQDEFQLALLAGRSKQEASLKAQHDRLEAERRADSMMSKELAVQEAQEKQLQYERDESRGNIEPEQAANNDKLLLIPRRYRNAHLAGLDAEKSSGCELTDREAWEWLKENGCVGYRLPDFDTFRRYREGARDALNIPRKLSRHGRTGRSIIKERDC